MTWIELLISLEIQSLLITNLPLPRISFYRSTPWSNLFCEHTNCHQPALSIYYCTSQLNVMTRLSQVVQAELCPYVKIVLISFTQF